MTPAQPFGVGRDQAVDGEVSVGCMKGHDAAGHQLVISNPECFERQPALPRGCARGYRRWNPGVGRGRVTASAVQPDHVESPPDDHLGSRPDGGVDVPLLGQDDRGAPGIRHAGARSKLWDRVGANRRRKRRGLRGRLRFPPCVARYLRPADGRGGDLGVGHRENRGHRERIRVFFEAPHASHRHCRRSSS